MSNPYAPPGSRPRADGRRKGPPGDTPTAPPTTGRPAPEDRPPGPPTTGRPAPGTPPRPADPETLAAVGRHVRLFALLMGATLVTSALPLPWQASAVVFAVGSLVAGARALRTVWLAGLRGALPLALGVGLGFGAVMTASLVAMLALWPVQAERQECLRSALTISAQEACEERFEQELTDRLVGGLGAPG